MKRFSNVARLTIALLLAVCGDAGAQSPARDFNIPAGDMRAAVDAYALQSGVQLLYKVAELDGLAGQAVKGRMAPEAALSQLLKGTPLRIVRDGANAVVLVRPAAPARPPAHAAPRAAAEPQGEPVTVLVSGLRDGLDSARDRKRYNDAISDAIVADEAGKLPDQNTAEAAQRIPGVQMQRYMEEGGAFAVRGLKQSKVLLNGLEVYGARAHAGESNGRNLDLEDLSAEVLAGIDVTKTASANDLEGGLGSTLNIRTRQPFDFPGPAANLTVKATSYRMAPGFGSKTRTQGSVLLSRRWQSGAGEMGLLVNAARTGSVFGLTENEVQRPQAVENYAGSGRVVTLPVGMFTGNGHHGGRQRDSYVAAFQWRPSAALSVQANYFGIDYALDQQFQTARFYPGRPEPDFTVWNERNSDGSANLRSGSFTASTMTDASVVSREGRKARLADIGARWNGGALTVKARLSHNRTVVQNTLLEWGLNARVPWMSLSLNDGAASHLSVAGVDLTDPASYHPAYLLSIAANGMQKNTAAMLDASIRLDHPAVRSADFGLRLNDYTRRAVGFVHLYCIDSCNSASSLATADPALVVQVPPAQSREIGPYLSLSSAAVRQQAALRTLYGLPAVDADMPERDQLNRERSAAAYVKINIVTELGAKPVRGNLGLRYVGTALRSSSYAGDAAGAPQLQATDATRHDLLPSFNASIQLRDAVLLRLAASKTVGQVNFANLSAGVHILNPVQHDAQEGNPSLQPYTSRNADVALERYFGANGMAFASAFYKLVDGFIQTTAERRIIGGEPYSVATYHSAGLSRIKGIETGYQRFFDGLPAPFDGLGVQLNFAYVDARAPSSLAGAAVPLAGLSRNSCNLIGLYERGKVKARLAYNRRSSYVSSTSSSGAQGVAVYAKAFGTLDFSLGYDISPHLSLVLDGANLTGGAIEYYYGNTHNPMSYVPLNKRYSAQVRYVF